MKISNHIHFVDQEDQCLRYDIHIDQPTHLGALLGNDDRVSSLGSIHPANAIPPPQEVPVIVSATGILHVVEAMPMGSVLSVALRSGHVVQDLVIRPGDDLTVLASAERLVLWIISGQDGILSVKARLTPDKDHVLSKIRQNLSDLPLREYLTRKMCFYPQSGDPHKIDWPDVMKLPEAAAFLRMGESTLRTCVAEGRVRRTPSKKFLRKDLEAYLQGVKPRRGRS